MALILGGGAFGKWSGREGGTLIHGISALIKEALESILPLSLLHHERTQQKGTIYEKVGSHQIPNPGTRILDFPASRTVK